MNRLTLLIPALLALLVAGCGEESGGEGAAGGPATVDPATYTTTASGLKYAVLSPGSGLEAKDGQQVAVHYTGWLKEGGTKFVCSATSLRQVTGAASRTTSRSARAV